MIKNKMIKRQLSHISISSQEESNNSGNCVSPKNSNNKNKIKFKNKNIEQYLNKLILISLRHKKFLEKNDYFYSQLHKKTKLKKVKLKLTPFQQYEKLKIVAKKMHINTNVIKSFPPEFREHMFENEKLINLFTVKNDKCLKKNKTIENSTKLCLTNYRPTRKNNKNENGCMNTLNMKNNIIYNNFNNYLLGPKIKKNQYSNISYDYNNNNNNNLFKTSLLYKNNKTNNLKRYKISNLFNNYSKDNKIYNNALICKRSIGVFTRTEKMRSLRLFKVNSRNSRNLGLPKISFENTNTKYKVPLVHMDNSKFVNEIKSVKS